MALTFEIIKLFDHHNRGQFIVARPLNFKEPIVIKEPALLKGIPIYHCLDMYPNGKEEKVPNFDVFVFRPVELQGYPKEYFRVGEIIELL